MHTDVDFLEALRADPKDDATCLVYADWLEEQDDPVSAAKAEFLRVTVQLAGLKGRKGARKTLRKRLQQLAAGLDTDWLAMVSRLAVENCQGKQAKGKRPSMVRLPIRFDFLCERRWEDMGSTDDGAVRFCDSCQKNVHYCDTIVEAREHAWAGHCIALDLGVIRREGDLAQPRLVRGKVSPDYFRQERERMEPDPVSAERERQKQEKGKS